MAIFIVIVIWVIIIIKAKYFDFSEPIESVRGFRSTDSTVVHDEYPIEYKREIGKKELEKAVEDTLSGIFFLLFIVKIPKEWLFQCV